MIGQRKGEESVNYNGFLWGNMIFISGVCHEKKKCNRLQEMNSMCVGGVLEGGVGRGRGRCT